MGDPLLENKHRHSSDRRWWGQAKVLTRVRVSRESHVVRFHRGWIKRRRAIRRGGADGMQRFGEWEV